MFEFKEFMSRLEVPHEGKELSSLKNPDIEPMPVSRRAWGFWSYFGYWAVPNVSIFTYSIGSSLLAVGLNIKQTIGAITLGNIILIIYASLGSGPGSKFRIGYTVCQRMVFGIFGSGLGILIRILLSIVYYGSQSYLGALGIVVMLSSLSENYMNMENTFPESIHLPKREFISFFVFNIIEYFFFFIRPEKMGPLVNGSCFITLIAMLGVFGWCLRKCYEITGGPGAMWSAPITVPKSEVGWLWLQAITIFYGALSPNCTNMSDFSRFTCSNKGMIWGIAISIASTGTLIPIMGMVTASNTQEIYGEAMWLPTDICLRWLQDDFSSGTRCAAFFCGLAFASSQLTFNVLANGFAGGMDLSGVFPRYINIFRGAVITATVSWACQPWNFYNTASAFNSVMASFGVIMSPILGIIVADFYLVRKKNVRVSHLYTTDKDGDYYYSYGVNFRAMICFFAAVAPGLPGLAESANPEIVVSEGIFHYYQNSTIFSFICPLILYYLICLVFPPKGTDEIDDYDYFDCFTEKELETFGMLPYEKGVEIIEGFPMESSSLSSITKVA
ncbi:unnamed protein product [[Candida] boidinii]|uniref:Unnamed protein product n=1 Tax=Candida boidinii TaxID=5477 RepID=A0ACB5TLV2_CANBO|nr:unnamed protein product [[Candida] boidinii]